MDLKLNSTLGKFLYFILFILVLPVLLIMWAIKTEGIIQLPVLDFPILGSALAVGGFIIMVLGMIGLYVYGNGLPMNPFPPKNYVTKGIFKLMSHPIYTGAALLAVGISIFAKSSSGLWLISTILIFSCIALVLGFERENLRKRFGDIQFKPLICIPDSSEQPTSVCDKVSIYILVIIPWLILYQLMIIIGNPENPRITYLPFESNIPVFEFTAIFYLMTYPLVIILPILIKTKKYIRNFMVSSLLAIGFGYFLNIIFPFIAPLKPFAASSIWGKLLEFERLYHASFLTFPAFPVIWVCIASSIYVRRFPSLKAVWILISVLVLLSCITTGMYSIIDVMSGYLIFLLANQRKKVWHIIQRASEYLANSWKEWHLGRIRIINHGFYAGIATATGVIIVGTLIGQENLLAILVVTIVLTICAGLWAQIIEGSAKLLRPFGYYGGVIGVILGSIIGHFLFRTDFFFMLAAFSVAGPAIQAIGRLRCLVQGCCHGKITTPNTGIRHFHERSRVCRISNLKNEYLHPTPVYSILSNIVIGIFLAKLWFANAPPPLISGLYLILSGLCRFVEEGYRGEPQTPIFWALRLYQWTALIGIIVGAFLTTIPYRTNPIGVQFSIDTLIISILLGLLSTFAMGVDFPNSNKRFSRLV